MKIRQIATGIALAALACASAQADPFTLTNGGVTADGDTGVGATTVLLDTLSTPDAGTSVIDNLFRNDVFIDDGVSVRSLTSLPALAFTATATTLDASFDGGTFQVNLVYDLDASGVLNETITINAISAVSLRVWDYTDFDVAGTAGADTATLISPSQISQTDSAANVTASVAVTAPVPDAFEIGGFPGLVNAVIAGTDLANIDGGTPDADNAFAFQWNFTLAASETAGIVKTRSISMDSTGACVIAATCNDDCSVTTADACAATGGTYLGDDSTCPAADLNGACCLGDGMCVETCAADCSALAGSYLGDGSTCPTGDFGFGGTDSMGDWTLTVNDDAGGDVGVFESWSVSINGTAYNGAVINLPIDSAGVNPQVDVINVPDSVSITDVEVSVTIAHTFAADLEISVTGPTGITRLLTDDLGGVNHLGDMGDPTLGAPVTYTFSDAGTQNWSGPAVDPVPAGVYSPIEALNTSADDPCADTGCACEFGGDAAMVDVQDLLAFLALWFVNDAGADLNGGGVDVTDLLEFLACWFPASANGTCP